MNKFFILGLIALSSTQVFAAELKDFTTSCKSIELDTASISAVCVAENGGKYKTAIRLRGLNNHGGELTFDEDTSKMSNFYKTCQNMSVDSHGRLYGECKDHQGEYVHSVVDLKDVVKNYNGTLVYPLD